MVDQLEQAVAISFGPLEKLFKKADLDVDGLIATVREHLFRPGRPARREDLGQHPLLRRPGAQHPASTS